MYKIVSAKRVLNVY